MTSLTFSYEDLKLGDIIVWKQIPEYPKFEINNYAEVRNIKTGYKLRAVPNSKYEPICSLSVKRGSASFINAYSIACKMFSKEDVDYNLRKPKAHVNWKPLLGYPLYDINRNGDIRVSKTKENYPLYDLDDGPIYKLVDMDGHPREIHTKPLADKLFTSERSSLEFVKGKLVNTSTSPVQIRNVVTDEITTYPTATSAAEALGISRGSLEYRLSKPHQRIWPNDLQIRRASNLPWDQDPETTNTIGHSSPVQTLDIWTREVRDFDSIMKAKEFLGVGQKAIPVALASVNVTLINNRYVVRYKSSKPWGPNN